ncbi:MAG: pyridoxamine 5'-phosphate oxidase [Sphingobacterium sp.]
MSIEHKEIAAIREDYSRSALRESEILKCPIEQFIKWFDEARHAKVTEPTAMTLSTVNDRGYPSSRIVLLKDIKKDGLSFFTNYNSRKGQDLVQNPAASVLFFWPELQRQVRVEAIAEKLSVEESEEYFSSRPRGSQIGAIASPQSRVIADRKDLEDRVAKVERDLKELDAVPCPDFWGGFLLKPTRMEFWQGRSNRLHDRIEFTKLESNWIINRLAP